ncbi:MAG: hypothetical protein JOY54_03885 [Acidobacteriaceae bacterium]|nr:hypothetical protein [Acidobacteriaceae bacterium]
MIYLRTAERAPTLDWEFGTADSISYGFSTFDTVAALAPTTVSRAESGADFFIHTSARTRRQLQADNAKGD